MKIATRAKLMLAKRLKLQLAEISTDKGVLYFDGTELEEGMEVFAMDEEGNYILPEDGDYVYNDEVISVVAGIVTVIRNPEVEVENEEVKPEDEVKEEEKMEVMPEEVPEPVVEDYVPVEEFNQLLEVVKDLAEEVSSVSTELKTALKMSRQEFVPNTPKVETDNETKRESSLSKFGLK